MVKSIGPKKIRTAVFISGTGSNFKNLIFDSLKKKSKYKIKLVISNKATAKGIKYARKFKIKRKIINYINKKNAEKNILVELEKNKIDLVCLAGFMKILSNNLLFFKIIELQGPVFLSLINFMIPLIAYFSGVLFLNEIIRVNVLVSLAMILFALYLNHVSSK